MSIVSKIPDSKVPHRDAVYRLGEPLLHCAMPQACASRTCESELSQQSTARFASEFRQAAD
eukprot:5796178-Alexandrium_andersonii.AAC.1